MNWLLFLLVLLSFLLVAAGGCSNQAKNKNPNATDDKASPAKKLPIATVDETDLAKEYTKHTGQRVEVAGTVQFTPGSDNTADTPMVVLVGYKREGDVIGTERIRCLFPLAAEEKIMELGLGQKVKIRGTVLGTDLLDCELSDVGSSTVLQATVDELLAGLASAMNKYEHKSVQVRGKVADVKWADDKKAVSFFLAPSDKAHKQLEVHCQCHWNVTIRERLAAVTKGQVIRVQGQCQPPFVHGIFGANLLR